MKMMIYITNHLLSNRVLHCTPDPSNNSLQNNANTNMDQKLNLLLTRQKEINCIHWEDVKKSYANIEQKMQNMTTNLETLDAQKTNLQNQIQNELKVYFTSVSCGDTNQLTKILCNLNVHMDLYDKIIFNIEDLDACISRLKRAVSHERKLKQIEQGTFALQKTLVQHINSDIIKMRGKVSTQNGVLDENAYNDIQRQMNYIQDTIKPLQIEINKIKNTTIPQFSEEVTQYTQKYEETKQMYHELQNKLLTTEIDVNIQTKIDNMMNIEEINKQTDELKTKYDQMMNPLLDIEEHSDEFELYGTNHNITVSVDIRNLINEIKYDCLRKYSIDFRRNNYTNIQKIHSKTKDLKKLITSIRNINISDKNIIKIYQDIKDQTNQALKLYDEIQELQNEYENNLEQVKEKIKNKYIHERYAKHLLPIARSDRIKKANEINDRKIVSIVKTDEKSKQKICSLIYNALQSQLHTTEIDPNIKIKIDNIINIEEINKKIDELKQEYTQMIQPLMDMEKHINKCELDETNHNKTLGSNIKWLINHCVDHECYMYSIDFTRSDDTNIAKMQSKIEDLKQFITNMNNIDIHDKNMTEIYKDITNQTNTALELYDEIQELEAGYKDNLKQVKRIIRCEHIYEKYEKYLSSTERSTEQKIMGCFLVLGAVCTVLRAVVFVIEHYTNEASNESQQIINKHDQNQNSIKVL